MEDLKRRRPKTIKHWSLEALRERQTDRSNSHLLDGEADVGQDGAFQSQQESQQESQVEESPISETHFKGE